MSYNEGKKESGSDWNLRPCLELDDFKDAYENNAITKLCIQLGRLKKDYTELGYIEDAVTRIALANPNVAIKLSNENVHR